ncbi:hypothetical protein ACJX0J_011954, partial [Zea mays]
VGGNLLLHTLLFSIQSDSFGVNQVINSLINLPKETCIKIPYFAFSLLVCFTGPLHLRLNLLEFIALFLVIELINTSLAQFCVDLTMRASGGLIDPVIGHKEIERILILNLYGQFSNGEFYTLASDTACFSMILEDELDLVLLNMSTLLLNNHIFMSTYKVYRFGLFDNFIKTSQKAENFRVTDFYSFLGKGA